MNIMEEKPILVVEDDGLIRMDMVSMLEDLGFDVLEAANADQALETFDKVEVGALLTDIDMPGSMNGVELAAMTAERYPNVHIVVISGRYDPENNTLPNKATFLTKPICEEVLGGALADIGFGMTPNV